MRPKPDPCTEPCMIHGAEGGKERGITRGGLSGTPRVEQTPFQRSVWAAGNTQKSSETIAAGAGKAKSGGVLRIAGEKLLLLLTCTLRYRLCRQRCPLGLSPKTRDMPVIQKKSSLFQLLFQFCLILPAMGFFLL